MTPPHWIAFASSESGRSEVYVAAFPESRGRWQVSTAGGDFPRWRRDSRELYFVANDQLMAATVATAAGKIEVGVPQSLLAIPSLRTGSGYPYDVTADGQRFLVNVRDGPIEPATITFVPDWRALLGR